MGRDRTTIGMSRPCEVRPIVVTYTFPLAAFSESMNATTSAYRDVSENPLRSARVSGLRLLRSRGG